MFQHSLDVSPSRQATPVQEVALDIDPLCLCVRVKGEEHHFADKEAMESFLKRLWETALVA